MGNKNELIRELTEKYKNDLTSFIQRLVNIPSVNGEKDEIEMAKAVDEEAKKLGLKSQLIYKNEKRPNIFVGNDLKGSSELLFVSHMDTVPTGDVDKWNYDPFSGQIEDGKLYGRGAIDCKAGGAVAVYALKILKELGYEDKAKYVGVSDEEGAPDSDLGAAYLLQQGLKAKAAIYTYPNINTVTIGHRGLVRLWVEVSGESAHSGTKEWQQKVKGANAIEAAANLIVKLKEIEMEGENENFPGYKFVHTVTLMEGGSGESIVPDKAKLLIDARLLPEHDPDEYINRINELARGLETDKIKFEVKIKNKIPGAVISKDEKIVTVLKELDEEVMGIKPEIKGCGPVNEGYMFIKAGIPTICGFGPQGEGAHSANELVDLSTIGKILEMYVKAAIELK